MFYFYVFYIFHPSFVFNTIEHYDHFILIVYLIFFYYLMKLIIKYKITLQYFLNVIKGKKRRGVSFALPFYLRNSL